MLYFRACPRCKTGTVELSSDTHGWYLSCLNCGFQKAGDVLRAFAARRAATASNGVKTSVVSHPAAIRPHSAAVNS